MDFISYNDIGSIYEEKNNYEMAEKYFKKSLEINPKYFRALFNMGVVKRDTGDLDKALEYYMEATKYNQNPYIYLNMSAIFIERQDYKGAIDILNKGIMFILFNFNFFV